MQELLERCFGFIGGLAIGAASAMLSIASGDVKIITSDFICVKTALVGASPNREESCVRYELKEQNNGK